MMKRFAVLLCGVVCAAVLLAGCSHMSVKHLNRQHWTLESGQSLPMKFWRFDYAVVPLENRFAVRGTAFPVQDAIPRWAEYIGDLWFSAYLSDKEGHVVASDLRVFQPSKLDRAQGVDFEFVLKPDTLETDDELYITFGYRMKLTANRFDDVNKSPGDPTGGEVFFASEGALTRY
jgi:hypothetical protein